MAERIMKRVGDSYTTQVQVLTQGNLNGYSRLFGGQLMEWIDIVAAVTARRHSGRNVTTLCVNRMLFLAPAHANDTLVLNGEIVYVGRTSMDIRVCVYVEQLSGERKFINEAFVTMVAIDENERPTEVPGLLIETEEQQQQWNAAEERRRADKAAAAVRTEK